MAGRGGPGTRGARKRAPAAVQLDVLWNSNRVVTKLTLAAHVHEARFTSRCMSPDFGDAKACPLPMRGAPGEIYLRIYVEY